MGQEADAIRKVEERRSFRKTNQAEAVPLENEASLAVAGTKTAACWTEVAEEGKPHWVARDPSHHLRQVHLFLNGPAGSPNSPGESFPIDGAPLPSVPFHTKRSSYELYSQI